NFVKKNVFLHNQSIGDRFEKLIYLAGSTTCYLSHRLSLVTNFDNPFQVFQNGHKHLSTAFVYKNI
ncbi:hypothetical protein, partial [Enterococcus faecium]|uniref:hypothetical protein n=1 Tax=Enterococcus faecium TaxID=1352 RepID=UPI0031CD5321